MDAHTICRLCCEKKHTLLPILKESDNCSLQKIFNAVLQLEVHADDGLPQNICRTCIVTLTKMHSTIEVYRANDLMLRKQLLGVADVEIKEEEVEMDIERLEESFTQEMTVFAEANLYNHEKYMESAGDNDSDLQEEEYQSPEENEAFEIIQLKKKNKKLKKVVAKRQNDSSKGDKNEPSKRRNDQPIAKGKRMRHIPEYDDPNLPRLNDHKCYICKTDSLGSGEALVAHLNIHTNEVPYTCTICVKETVEIKSVATLNMHKRMHEKPYKCPHCDKRYSTKGVIAQHVQMYHMGDNDPCPSTCAHCGKVCPTKLSLQNHQKIHTQAVSCEFCGKLFSTKNKLKLHIERVHKKTKKVECTVCQKKLKSLCSLHIHMKTSHSNDEFKCELCPKRYTSQIALRNHQKNHEKNPNYTTSNDWKKYYVFLDGEEGIKDGVRLKRCNICGAITKAIGPHLSTMHFPKQLRCELCGMVFKRKYSYETHVKEHENGKAFSCPICNREFSEKKNLVAHLKTKKHQDHPLAKSLDWINEKTEKGTNSENEENPDFQEDKEYDLDV